MAKISTILLELLNIFPRYKFEKLEKRYNGNHYTKYFTGWQQLITLLFAQAGGKDSLRDIETSLSVHYTENIFWPETNGIKLISAGDSSNTIIDGGGISSVIYMNNESGIIDNSTLIEGFTIQGGGWL
ncbi:MAG: DUF4372 domain-containing protein [Bacteroidetes bacterium]|nr:DUF4372 domain-containing protein [Bacteroidota bacterium]